MQTADIPLRKVAAVAVVKNPLVGCYQDDLSELVAASPSIGELVAGLALAALAPFQPESYGTAAVVGLRGEQEHGVALLTTPFGNILREAASGGLAWISSQSKRASPAPTNDVPLAHQDALYVRSHYASMDIHHHNPPHTNQTDD